VNKLQLLKYFHIIFFLLLKLSLQGLRHQHCSHHLSLRDHKRRLNGFKLLGSMHLTKSWSVFESGVALSLTPEVSQIYLSCFGVIWPRLFRCAVKPKQKSNSNLFIMLIRVFITMHISISLMDCFIRNI
jgi:hypothetical protein